MQHLLANLALLQDVPAATSMTGAAKLFMGLSVSFVLVLGAWCYYKVLTIPDEE